MPLLKRFARRGKVGTAGFVTVAYLVDLRSFSDLRPFDDENLAESSDHARSLAASEAVECALQRVLTLHDDVKLSRLVLVFDDERPFGRVVGP